MPDPKQLKVGDRVRFVSLPDEWEDPESTILPDSIEFMNVMIARLWPSRVYEVDECGTPWIAAQIRQGDQIEHHRWGITEESGWRLVKPRK